MKKLLTILTGFTVTITPATQIVSCQITPNNTYKNPSDIEEFWNFKSYNTISVDPANVDGALFETNLKELIANNFRNQEVINKVLGNEQNTKTQTKDEQQKISFKYFKNSQGVEITDISEYLKTILSDKVAEQKTIYFKYSFDGTTYNNSYLKLNVTNIPKVK
ncbi:lipoprotein [Spiroplasma sp. BIUS-1]|uniref:lipoprotein n=1 Tax=Spiroplasma sp. BIUS-1 TaxID=216964 RepID=UPI0013972E22|nr:lipoprotein [Spiroplasma sp. BIUS-1]QHX36679.1 hypothetical protein SBIUS_v1c04260 [Spiroplasma sp. BIUS-1]